MKVVRVMRDGRFAGVARASEEHAVCVVDEHGRSLDGRRYRPNESGIAALCSRLLSLDVARVAIEQPGGLLIERLLDAGLMVIAVHRNQVKALESALARRSCSVGRASSPMRL